MGVSDHRSDRSSCRIAFAVYKYLTPDYMDDFDEDFDDDFDDDFFDEEDDTDVKEEDIEEVE